ncbi:unnamed protein product [Owenia fusiformis]|uniref:Methyltransferase domain-containing protein n=1 Tax=Owenia fusiformis TaxID=6347 RepID=A0A8S4PDV4_OWEFU|nr:unnamed protein product [Owenia fusiformis]
MKLKKYLLFTVFCQTILTVFMIYKVTQKYDNIQKPKSSEHHVVEKYIIQPTSMNGNNFNNGNYSKTIFNNYHNSNIVSNCITGDATRRRNESIMTKEFTDRGSSGQPENPETRQRSFEMIFRDKIWMGHLKDSTYSGLQASGLGSNLFFAQEFMATLHIVMNWIKAQTKSDLISILDVACGDMQWMSRFLTTRDDVIYTGLDIVPDLINHHKKNYEKYNWIFATHDITLDVFPGRYDIIICRMMLQHLKHHDAVRALSHMANAKYILLTTFPRVQENIDLDLEQSDKGRVRFLNMELPPFSLAPPICLQRDGPKNEINHFVGLWPLPLRQIVKCNYQKVKMSNPNMNVYSC